MSARTIAVIGGGAAGMMATAVALESPAGARVTLFERNRRLGAKVRISGGGRCNVTTGVGEVRDVLARYPRGARWLRHAMHSFPPSRVIAWFEAHGVPLKTEADLRVFPASDDGDHVVGAFERLFAARAVDLRLRTRVTAIVHDAAGGDFRVETAAGGVGPFTAVIVTTGGAAFRQTGSTGDGYRFAESLAHHVTPRFPSLTAYVVRERWAHELAGLTVADATLRIAPRDPGGATFQQRGAFVFTHVGVSGPAVFALCSLAAMQPYDEANPLALRIDLLPELSAQLLDARLTHRLTALGGRSVANVLDTLLPRSICAVLCFLAGVEPTLHAARVTKGQRAALVSAIKALPLTVTGRRSGEEFVTAGGVDTAAVDPRTMASRHVPGLYFGGEVLNVDGFTGGYNLQAAWATGALAGMAAGR